MKKSNKKESLTKYSNFKILNSGPNKGERGFFFGSFKGHGKRIRKAFKNSKARLHSNQVDLAMAISITNGQWPKIGR